MQEPEFDTRPVRQRLFIEDVLLKDKPLEVVELFNAKLKSVNEKTRKTVISRESLVILLMLTENEIERSRYEYVVLDRNAPRE